MKKRKEYVMKEEVKEKVGNVEELKKWNFKINKDVSKI